jgi:hypothetical protein
MIGLSSILLAMLCLVTFGLPLLPTEEVVPEVMFCILVCADVLRIIAIAKALNPQLQNEKPNAKYVNVSHRQPQSLWEALFINSLDPNFVFDRHGIILELNRAFSRIVRIL